MKKHTLKKLKNTMKITQAKRVTLKKRFKNKKETMNH